MMYALFFVSIFLAAWGNAMRKRSYRRRAMIADGKDVPEMGRFYEHSSVAIVVLGALGLLAWFVLITYGNPVVFFTRP